MTQAELFETAASLTKRAAARARNSSFRFELREQVAAWARIPAARFNHAMIAEYRPGTQLGWHQRFAIPLPFVRWPRLVVQRGTPGGGSVAGAAGLRHFSVPLGQYL